MAGRVRAMLASGILGLAVGVAAISAGGSEAQGPSPLAGLSEAVVVASAADIQQRAMKEAPDSFAGLWLTRNESGALEGLSLAFTEAGDDRAVRYANQFLVPRAVTELSVERSLAELEERQLDLIADRELTRIGDEGAGEIPSPTFDLDIDLEKNVAVVRVAQDEPALREALELRYAGDESVEVREVESRWVPEDCDTRATCKPRLRSGIAAVNEFGSGCSAAFAINNPSTGVNQILSAAHCSGTNRRNQGERYGDVVAERQSGRVDAERHRIHLNGFTSRGWIYVNESTKTQPVRSSSSWSGTVVGDLVTMSGATSGFSRGTVVSIFASPAYVQGAERFIETTYCSDGGDSGAGVFNGNVAHGIHSGGPETGCGGIYGHIEYVMNSGVGSGYNLIRNE